VRWSATGKPASASRLFNTPLGVLLGHEEPAPEPDVAAILLRFKDANEGHEVPDAAAPGIREFVRFLDAYSRLADAAKFPIRGMTQSPFISTPGYESADDARRKAEEVRAHLRLGIGPVGDVDSICELLGITVFRHGLGSDLSRTVSGAFLDHRNAVGFAILVNLDMTPGRRRFTIAHELAHALFHSDSRYSVSTARKTPRERFADAFAGEFLMPTEGMRRLIEEQGVGPRLSDPTEVIHLQRFFGVSFATALLRCLKAGLIKQAQYDGWSSVRPLVLARALGYEIADEEYEQHAERWKIERYPLRFRRLVRQAVRSEVISLATAAALTGLSIDEISELVAAEDRLGAGPEPDRTELNEYAASGIV
jgi:Zn-dependent peptidase ImmA (M78 family)